MTDAVTAVTMFVHACRRAGMKADHARLAVCIDAVAHVDQANLDYVYWAMRVTLCTTPTDLNVFDALFDEWFRPRRNDVVAQTETRTEGGSGSAGTKRVDAGTGASDIEALRTCDVADLTPAERAELNRLIAQIRARPAVRRQRRSATHRRGSIDLGRTAARMLRDGGELESIRYRRKRRRFRRLVLIIDISGSMGPYAELLLRFAHIAVGSAPRDVEVFTIGTRLTRITRELTTRDADLARTAALRSTVDWGGGTRLAEGVRSMIEGPYRGCVRGSIVVIATDGAEPGRAETLGRHLDRVGRLVHELLWVNPLAGMPATAIRAPAARILSERVNTTVPGSSVADLENLADVISRL